MNRIERFFSRRRKPQEVDKVLERIVKHYSDHIDRDKRLYQAIIDISTRSLQLIKDLPNDNNVERRITLIERLSDSANEAVKLLKQSKLPLRSTIQQLVSYLTSIERQSYSLLYPPLTFSNGLEINGASPFQMVYILHYFESLGYTKADLDDIISQYHALISQIHQLATDSLGANPPTAQTE